MPEPKEQFQGENPRLRILIDEIINDFSAVVPYIPRETLMGVAEKQALKILSAETKADEAEKERGELKKELDHDEYNPEIYSGTGWHRVMKDWLKIVRRNNFSGSGKGAVLIAGDLDHFKEFNDKNKSHVEGGNKALSLVGQCIKSIVRPGDIVARLHGDEFVVCVETDMKGGMITAEKIREAVGCIPELLETPLPVSISLGVVELGADIINTDYERDEEFLNALNRYYTLADNAMYGGSKETGRNKIGIISSSGQISTADLSGGMPLPNL